MQQSTINHLKLVAANLLQGKVSTPTSVVEQRAFAILKILNDGEWHTATEIADQLELKPKYIRDILRTVQDDWNLQCISSKHKGWRLPKK
jgi:transcription initiation factor IIE alpha subunit